MSHDTPPPLPHDIEFDDIMRALVADESVNDDPPPDPWQSPDAFVAWLKASDFPGPNNNISRYLRALYLSRPDLSRAFPEVPGRDTGAFYRWAHEHGVTNVPIPATLLPPTQWHTTPRRPRRPRHPGVNLVGFLDDALGIGEKARRIGAAFDAAGVPVKRIGYSPGRGVQTVDAALDVNLVCINPDSLARFVHDYESLVHHRYTIGVWAWETEELPPAFGWAFDYVDELWTESQFVYAALVDHTPERVVIGRFDMPIVAPPTDPNLDRRTLGLPDDRFVFLTSFDYFSVVDRKNPEGVIEAFSLAFAPDEGPVLLVKSINGSARRDDQSRVRHAARGRADIMFVDERLPPEHNAALIAHSDCLVSLHRSEGFGINIADALALGRPVIATGYGANVEYMVGLEDWLVPYSLIEVGEGKHPYPSHHHWAHPDVDAAAAMMRRVVADPASARTKAMQHGRGLIEEFSPMNVGLRLDRRLSELRRRQPPRFLARVKKNARR